MVFHFGRWKESAFYCFRISDAGKCECSMVFAPRTPEKVSVSWFSHFGRRKEGVFYGFRILDDGTLALSNTKNAKVIEQYFF